MTALLEERHVATVQGTAYGMSPYFRISYATDLESLREGCKRIQEFCADLEVWRSLLPARSRTPSG